MRLWTVGNRAIVGVGVSVFLFAAPASAEDQCVACHAELDEEPSAVSAMEHDVHAKYDVSCADCHGGDPAAEDMDIAMDPEDGFLGAPARSEIPEFCGRCHQDAAYMRQYNPGIRLDQVDLYWTSVHGQKLASGDKKVATCVDCHHAHGILPASDARSPIYAVNVPATCGTCHSDPDYMAPYDISTDQVEDYMASVHGQLLMEKGGRAAPACNDCHGNHGAAPPGVSSVTNVCGQCHPLNAQLLSKSPHAEPFAEMGIPACESCHGNHRIEHPTDERLGAGDNSVCIDCHEDDSKGYLTAVAMKSELTELREGAARARELLERAEHAGMEVRDAKYQLSEVDNAITKARSTVHAFSLSAFRDVTEPGDVLADSTVQMGQAALAELDYRRKGLGLATLFVVIVVGALYIKIRQADQEAGM